jgi:transposase
LSRFKRGQREAEELYEISAIPCPKHPHNEQYKIADAQQAIEAAGAQLLYLPPYSPDLNPIEMAFFELKALLRNAAERAILGLLRKIGRIAKTFSPRVQT